MLAGSQQLSHQGTWQKGKQGKDLAMLVGDWHQAISYLCLQAMISHILITSVRNLYKMAGIVCVVTMKATLNVYTSGFCAQVTDNRN